MNSSNSLNENLADNGGTRTAFKAVKKIISSSNNKDSTSTDDFSNDQMFFIGFGTVILLKFINLAMYLLKFKLFLDVV